MTIKILAVDSDAEVLRLLDIRLKKAGYEVILTNNGSEALDLAQTEPPTVVITRVRLPGMDGLALTRRLKALPHPPLVILLTMLTGDHDIAAAFEAGADDFMTKPFSPLVLLERLRVNLTRTGRAAPATPAESEAVDE